MREKWPILDLGEALPDEKSGRKRRSFAHRPHFCARFLLKFCPFSRFCKHAKFSKVNAKFSKVVDFFFPNEALFLLKSNQHTDNQPFIKPSKNRRFFVQKVFSWRIFEIWRPKTAFLSILFIKMNDENRSTFFHLFFPFFGTFFRKDEVISEKNSTFAVTSRDVTWWRLYANA